MKLTEWPSHSYRSKPRVGDQSRTCIAIGECRPAHQPKKDRTTWCRGRVGVEHQWDWLQCDRYRSYGRPFRVSGANRPMFRSNLDDIHGYSLEMKHCHGCGRDGSYRHRCHCGEYLVRAETGQRWDYYLVCPGCLYTPDWPRIYAGMSSEWQYTPDRPCHACEKPIHFAPVRMRSEADLPECMETLSE